MRFLFGDYGHLRCEWRIGNGEHDDSWGDTSSLYVQLLSESTVIVRVFVRVHTQCVCVWGQERAGKEIWPWTLCLTGPFSKEEEKRKRSDIPFHYTLKIGL